MHRHFTSDGIGTSAVRPGVLRQEIRLGDHVVVEEQHDFTRRRVSAAVAGGGLATIALLDNMEGKRTAQPPQRSRGSIAGPVDHDDDFEASGVAEFRQSHDCGAYALPALARRDDDRKEWLAH